MRGEWSVPVEIEIGRENLYTIIPDTQAAAEALLYKWPIEEGVALAAAKQACLNVLSGHSSPDTARKAFITAADEAELEMRPAQRFAPIPGAKPTHWRKKKARSVERA